MKKVFAISLVLLLVNTVQAQVNFSGTWTFKQVVSDVTNADGGKYEEDLVIAKVTDEYYRSTVRENNLLYKLVKDSTIFSNFSPDREVTIVYKPDNTLQITSVYKIVDDGHNHGAEGHDHGAETPSVVVTIWEKKKN